MSKSRPSYPPTKKDWMKYSPIIAHLYKDNTLKVVMEIMIQRFGFRATQRMYKARLPTLGVRKYGKATNTTVQRLPANTLSSSISSNEMVVISVRRYAELHIALPQTSIHPLPNEIQSLAIPAPDETLWKRLYTGLALLEQQHRQQAFDNLEAACSIVRQVLLQQPRLFFRGIFMVFGTARWDPFRDIWAALFKFFVRMAFLVLGRLHPAFHVLHTLYTNTDDFQSSSELSLRCLLDSLEKTLPPLHPEVLRTRRNLSIILRRQEEPETGEQIMRQTITACERGLSVVDVETLRCLRRLAGLCMHHGKYEEAEDLLVEALRRAGRPDHTSGPTIDDTDTFVYAHRDLALIAMQQNDMTRCQIRLQQFASICRNKLRIIHNRPVPTIPDDLTLVGAELFIKEMIMAYDLHCDELASKFMVRAVRRSSG